MVQAGNARRVMNAAVYSGFFSGRLGTLWFVTACWLKEVLELYTCHPRALIRLMTVTIRHRQTFIGHMYTNPARAQQGQ